jgi:hypothetical protein
LVSLSLGAMRSRQVAKSLLPWKTRLRTLLLSFSALWLLFSPSPAASEPINDCLIAAARAQFELNPRTWNRLLIVRYGDRQLQHAYLVYADEAGGVVAYDNVHGTRHFQTNERSATPLSRLIDPWAKWGWYIEDNAHNRHLAAN